MNVTLLFFFFFFSLLQLRVGNVWRIENVLYNELFQLSIYYIYCGFESLIQYNELDINITINQFELSLWARCVRSLFLIGLLVNMNILSFFWWAKFGS